MSKNTELMLRYSDGELELEEAILFEKIILENPRLKREYILNQHLDEYMRIQKIMQQIQRDPELPDIESTTQNDVTNHVISKSDEDKSIAFFINEAFMQNNMLEELVDEAEREIFSGGIDNEVKKWVKEWEDQNKDYNNQDKYTRELTDYVKTGMKEGSKPQFRTLQNKVKKSRKLYIYLTSVAAAAILVFGISVVYKSEPGPNELFVQYYQPYQVVDGQTRSSQQINDKFKEAVKLYENNNFSKAAELFNELLKTETNTMKIQLLFGICQLEEQHYESAKLNFQGIINKNSEYIIEAKWYLAMTYFKTHEIKSAKILLKELTETPGYYKEKSRELLKKL